MSKSEKEILHEYWISYGLEETLPYKQASDDEKKAVAGTSGFVHYVFSVRVKEFRNEFINLIPKQIRRLFSIDE